MTKSQRLKTRCKKRHKQARVNTQLKRKLFGDLSISSCFYCLKVFLADQLTIEHIVPLCLGGGNESGNIALACAPCNQKQGKEAWFQKRKINKKYYEQYSSQHREAHRPRSI